MLVNTVLVDVNPAKRAVGNEGQSGTNRTLCREKVGSLQMTNRSVWRYPEKFRQTAMERFKCCEDVVHLANELDKVYLYGHLA